MIENYLSAEAPIIQQLSGIAGVKAVLSAADLAEVQEKSQTTPAIHVLYGGDSLSGGAGQFAGEGHARMVRQRWFAVVAVRNIRGEGKKSVRSDAGPIISAVLTKLQGFEPSAEHTPMQRVAAPAPVYRDGGFAYFPLAFETQIATVAEE